MPESTPIRPDAHQHHHSGAVISEMERMMSLSPDFFFNYEIEAGGRREAYIGKVLAGFLLQRNDCYIYLHRRGIWASAENYHLISDYFEKYFNTNYQEAPSRLYIFHKDDKGALGTFIFLSI